ncbi:hypothetical protein [Methylorubrum extorquens]
MLGYKKIAFSQAHSLLQKLRSEPSDLSTLLKLQKALIAQSIRTEQHIRKIKSDLQSIAQAAEQGDHKRARSVERRLDGVRQCPYIFRCFGDAIAFIYCDKHALKQTYYNTHNTSPKQSAGFFS